MLGIKSFLIGTNDSIPFVISKIEVASKAVNSFSASTCKISFTAFVFYFPFLHCSYPYSFLCSFLFAPSAIM